MEEEHCQHVCCRIARARELTKQGNEHLTDLVLAVYNRYDARVPCLLARVDRELAAIRRRVLAWH